MGYLTPRALCGLKQYKYKAGGYTWLDDAHQPFWNGEREIKGEESRVFSSFGPPNSTFFAPFLSPSYSISTSSCFPLSHASSSHSLSPPLTPIN